MARQRRNSKSDHKQQPAQRFVPKADGNLKKFFNEIGLPDSGEFVLDDFQQEAIDKIKENDVLVSAPTGSGKTLIAIEAMKKILADGKRAWYASPLKALSNSKYHEFENIYGKDNVGVITGDRKENTDAEIVVGTTEILRNQLYDAMASVTDFNADLVILDEAHYLGDQDRGVVWEEIMIYLPRRVRLLMLSATIPNDYEIAQWLENIRKHRCEVVHSEHRSVPIQPLYLLPNGELVPLAEKAGVSKKINMFLEKQPRKKFGNRGTAISYDKIMHVLKTFNLLPVIFFLKSRSDCNFAVSSCHRHILAGHRSEAIEARLHELLADFPFLEGHAQTRNLIHHGLGSHHGGQLPHWKIIVEKLMNEGLLDAMFSTSTVAAGVNFPARSVVMVQSDRFNGKEFVSLSSTELHQAIGRAGRRGKDKIGFALMAHGPFQDPHLIARLLKKDPEAIESQIKINFSMCLNLLLSQTPDEVFKLLNDSFATFQRAASVRDLEERYNDSNEELDRLTEGARCQDANQMAELITKRSDGYKRLSALISKKKKYVKQCARAQADISEDGYIKHAAAEIADLSRELKNLPCKGCPCFTFCHQGKKKSHSGKLVLKTNELQAQLEHARSYLRIEFTRHLDFLILNGFATETGALTEDGLWASKLRLDQPLIIAELIRKNKFSSMTPEMLAAMIAVFVNDKYRDLELDTSISWSKKDVMGVYDQLKDAIQDLTRKKEEHNFKLPVLQFWPAAALYTWASGEGWEGVIRLTAVDEGDLAMLIFRTADNLRQLTSLEKTHPELAAKAHQSIRLLLREPVIIPL